MFQQKQKNCSNTCIRAQFDVPFTVLDCSKSTQIYLLIEIIKSIKIKPILEQLKFIHF